MQGDIVYVLMARVTGHDMSWAVNGVFTNLDAAELKVKQLVGCDTEIIKQMVDYPHVIVE